MHTIKTDGTKRLSSVDSWHKEVNRVRLRRNLFFYLTLEQFVLYSMRTPN
jgi:hypothetical protein